MDADTDPNELLWQFLENLPATIRSSFQFNLGGFLSGLTQPNVEDHFDQRRSSPQSNVRTPSSRFGSSSTSGLAKLWCALL
jgi:hypothetical protein